MDSETVWRADWSGSYPCLCRGEWSLYRDNRKVETAIPFQGSPAETDGLYRSWHFKDYLEDYDTCHNGLSPEAWVGRHQEWLATIAPEEEWKDIYEAFRASDWRAGSCGGCV